MWIKTLILSVLCIFSCAKKSNIESKELTTDHSKMIKTLNFKLNNSIDSKSISHHYDLSSGDGLFLKSAYNGFKNLQVEAWANTGAINNTTLDIGANFNVYDYLSFGTGLSNLINNIPMTNNTDTKKLKKYDLSIGADLVKFYGELGTNLNNEVKNVSVGVKGPLLIFKD